MKRRDFIFNSLAMAGVTAFPAFWPRTAYAAAPGQLVFIFLRGGADALGMVSPAGTAFNTLKALRPNLSIASPVALTSKLVLHPKLAPLISDAAINAQINFILHAGSINDTRSHFEQMARIESGDAVGLQSTGFLGRAAVSMNNRATFAIGSQIPTSLRGTNPVVIQDPAKLQGGLNMAAWNSTMTRSQRLGMYKKTATESGDAKIDTYARLAQTQYDLLDDVPMTLSGLVSAGQYINSRFGQRLATAGAMLASAANPAFVCVDGEHLWDTHMNQGTNDLTLTGMGAKIDDVARNLLAFKKDLVKRGKWATTTIVVVSEFGRTIKENQDRGCDHGRGGMMILMGAGVKNYNDTTYKGVREWTLPSGTLDSSSALDVKHDYRLVLAEILEKRCLIPRATVLSLFLNQIDAANYLSVVA